MGVGDEALVRPVEVGGVDRAGEVGDEHSAARQIEGEANPLHQMRDEDFRLGFPVDRRAIDGVAGRRIAAVGPVEKTAFPIEFEVDGLRQSVEEHLDVGAVRRAFALRDLDVGAQDAAQAGVVRPLLRPVDLAARPVDGDTDAPSGLVAHVRLAGAAPDQRLDVRAVEVRAHHAHALAVAPVELPAHPIELELLGRVCDARWNHRPAVPAIEIGALYPAVVEGGNPHVRPVDSARPGVDRDAVRQAAAAGDDLAVGPVGVGRQDGAAADVEEKQSAAGRGRWNWRARGLGCSHGFEPLLRVAYAA